MTGGGVCARRFRNQGKAVITPRMLVCQYAPADLGIKAKPVEPSGFVQPQYAPADLGIKAKLEAP